MADFGKLVQQRRKEIPLTLQELSSASGVSYSHLHRIERGLRFPSAPILKKLAKPLELSESQLFTMAGYLSVGDKPGRDLLLLEVGRIREKLDETIATLIELRGALQQLEGDSQ